MSIEKAVKRLNIDVSVKLSETGEPELIEDETLSGKFPGVTWYFGETANVGTGTLYALTRRLIWIDDSKQTVFGLRYQQIVIHAMSKPQESFPHNCIYLQLDDSEVDVDEEEETMEADGEEEEAIDSEVRLVPQADDQVEPIFKAMCACAELNSDDDDEDHDGEGDFFFDQDEVMRGLDPSTRAAVLAQGLDGAVRLTEGEEGEEAEEGEEGAAEEDLEELVGSDPSRFDDVE